MSKDEVATKNKWLVLHVILFWTFVVLTIVLGIVAIWVSTGNPNYDLADKLGNTAGMFGVLAFLTGVGFVGWALK